MTGLDPLVGPLDEGTVDADPFVQFGRWFDAASRTMAAPEAMALSTVGVGGRPSSRMVLLKQWGNEGFTFFTNYESRKGLELTANPHASLLFTWEPTGRQVRIEGAVGRISAEESDAYFASRPKESQIGAVASHQSRVIASRAELDARVAAAEARYRDAPVPRPERWGGMRLVPSMFEFWQLRPSRLHDRIRFLPAPSGWGIDRLQP